MITNRCDVSCGGCNQFCPNFSKYQFFNITLDELKKYIEILGNYRPHIRIYGGEPGLHPQWKEILEILKSYPQYDFLVFTKYPQKSINNIKFRSDPKDTKKSKRIYHPTLIAPKDIITNHCKDWFWTQAKKTCPAWRSCHTIIYDNKAYFCEVAAAMDRLFKGNYGWDINDEYPFYKTDQEIANQARNFCYRCGWAIAETRYIPQVICEKTKATFTNSRKIPSQKFIQKFKTNLKIY